MKLGGWRDDREVGAGRYRISTLALSSSGFDDDLWAGQSENREL